MCIRDSINAEYMGENNTPISNQLQELEIIDIKNEAQQSSQFDEILILAFKSSGFKLVVMPDNDKIFFEEDDEQYIMSLIDNDTFYLSKSKEHHFQILFATQPIRFMHYEVRYIIENTILHQNKKQKKYQTEVKAKDENISLRKL
eukprot:TRINITY_DN15422_c0_g1_i1.p2 TRINITY_DN15422_c0_g1~~TRINITY_DN15422_c0_g1_i1.p2  ORF type:complete len:145 (-),score=34.67 TRINITY_DN15422_c0_g1_i1:78-512(-)